MEAETIQEETVELTPECQHEKWGYSPVYISDSVKIGKVYRTCPECGLHQKAKLNWIDVED